MNEVNTLLKSLNYDIIVNDETNIEN